MKLVTGWMELKNRGEWEVGVTLRQSSVDLHGKTVGGWLLGKRKTLAHGSRAFSSDECLKYNHGRSLVVPTHQLIYNITLGRTPAIQKKRQPRIIKFTNRRHT